MGGAGRLQPQLTPRGSWDACPLQWLTGVWYQALRIRTVSLPPDLSCPSQSWLAFQTCAVVSSPPSPILAQDQLWGRLHLGRELPRGCSSTSAASLCRHLQLSTRLPSRVAKLASLERAWPLISPSPGSRCPGFPRPFHPEQPVPASWRFVPLSSPPPRPCCSGASSWQCKVSLDSGAIPAGRSRNPLPILQPW